jgi:predicted transcriptional regulator
MDQSTTGEYLGRSIRNAELGHDIRTARRGVNATQRDLARRVGCAQSAIARAETGAPISPALLKRILDALKALQSEARGR